MNDILSKAIANHKTAKLQEAKILYEEFLRIHPGHAEASHNLGALALEMGDEELASQLFTAAIEANPKMIKVWTALIKELIKGPVAEIQKSKIESNKIFNLLVNENIPANTSFDKVGLKTVTAKENRKLARENKKQKKILEKTLQQNKIVKHPDLTNVNHSMPTQVEVEVFLGHYKSGNLVEAEKLILEITKNFPRYAFGWKSLGTLMALTNRKIEAITPMILAIELEPRDPQAQNNLGVLLKDLKRYDDAEKCFKEAIRLKPDYIDPHFNLGILLAQCDRDLEAINSYNETLKFNPRHISAYNNLGVIFKKLGRFAEAEGCYRKAIQLDQNYSESYNNLGILLKDLGRDFEAEKCYRDVIRIKPDSIEGLNNLGNILRANNQLIEAIKIYQEAVKHKPDFYGSHYNLGNAFQSLGRYADAAASYKEAVRLNPQSPESHNNLGVTARELGHHKIAESYYREAIRLWPGFAIAHNNLGVVLNDLGRLTEAELSYKEAIKINPDYGEACNNLGVLFKDSCRLKEAEVCFRDAMRLKPDYAEARSNFLFSLNFTEGMDQTDYLNESRLYGEYFTGDPRKKYSSWICDKAPQKLKIGLVSGDFRNHPVGYFIEGLLGQINREKFEVFGYSSNLSADDLTQRIKPFFNKWDDLVGKTNYESAQLIHSDGLHILLDLSGHTAKNRLPIFSFKPAPIQGSYLGYFATTGLKEMDYFIGDPYVTPDTEFHHFTENIWQLPETYLCFTPPIYPIDVEALPACKNGFITFGCFNNLSKLGREVVELWAEVLRSIPGAKLFLKTKQLADASVQKFVSQQFLENGISSDRLILEGASPRSELLAAYSRVDIALDPFPYPGGTTSVEALWMGVPVLTLKGDRFLSHVGETIAYNAGQSEWVAINKEDYVNKAVFFTSDLNLLAKNRLELRPKVLSSAIFDINRFTKHFESAMWSMWNGYKNRIQA